MFRSAILLLLCSFLLASCKNDPNTATAATNSATNNQADPSYNAEDPGQPMKAQAPVDSSPLGMMKRSLSKSLSGTMIENVSLDGKTLSINYYSSAEAFKEGTPGATMDENSFKQYWITGNRGEKVLALIPSQMLYTHSNIDQVNVELPTAGKMLSLSINRDDLSDFTGKTWEELKKEWRTVYRRDVVMNTEKRKAFYDRFVKSK
mgnify:CR=1 FL=1